MKIWRLVLIAVLLVSMAMAVEITQSVRGNGECEILVDLGTASSSMSGQGSVSYAAKAVMTDKGAIMNNGLEFQGEKGSLSLQGSLGPDIGYDLRARDATSLSFRSSIDTNTREETQDSVLGKLLLYRVDVDGLLDGSVVEAIYDGTRMGRPVERSKMTANGTFEVNSTIDLKEYEV